MLKVLGSICIFAGGALAWRHQRLTLRRELDTLAELLTALRRMAEEIRMARVPLPVLARMGWNLLVDTGLGFIPVIGDAADVAHRANRKNYRLLERCVREGRHVDVDVPGYVVQAVAMVVAFIACSLAAVVLAIWGLLRVIGVIG